MYWCAIVFCIHHSSFIIQEKKFPRIFGRLNNKQLSEYLIIFTIRLKVGFFFMLGSVISTLLEEKVLFSNLSTDKDSFLVKHVEIGASNSEALLCPGNLHLTAA